MTDLSIIGKQSRYLCEKHGETGLIGLEIALEGREKERFCAECLLDLMREHCCILTEIKADG